MIPIERTLEEFIAANGKSPFRSWFDGLHAQARAKVTIALSRFEQGNDGAVKSVGAGVNEIRVDWGPGYRIYFGQDGAMLVILLGGGTKQRQDRDIADAKMLWADYKLRKKG